MSDKPHHINKDRKDYVNNDKLCRRDFLFQDMDHYQHVDMGSKCMCCDICANICKCGSCCDNRKPFVFMS